MKLLVKSLVLLFFLSATGSASALTFNVTHESSSGANDGAIDLVVSGGTFPYAYAWSNGATSQDISNLPPGTYWVTVTDIDGCTAMGSATVLAASGSPGGGEKPFPVFSGWGAIIYGLLVVIVGISFIGYFGKAKKFSI